MAENPKNAFVAKYKSKIGNVNKKIVDPDKLLQDIETRESTTTTTLITTNKTNQDGNWVEDEDKGGILFGQDNKSTQIPKSIKKKTNRIVTATWAEVESKEEEGKSVPQPETKVEHVVQSKKKILNLPGSKAKETKIIAPTFDDNDFVTLGEERKEQPKPIIEKTIEKATEKKINGPPTFINTKKLSTNTLNQVNVEPQLNLANTKSIEDKTAEDSKFKFSPEKPRFVNMKASEKKVKDIQKSEAELLREQKEKEIEERLQKEREELKKKDTLKNKKEHLNCAETEISIKESSTEQEKNIQAEPPKFMGKGFTNLKKKENQEVSQTHEIINNEVSQEGTIENNTNHSTMEIKLVKKNGKSRAKKIEDNNDLERKEKKGKKQHQEKDNNNTVQSEIKKEEPKILPAHEVIEVSSTNITASSWDVELKKIPKKKQKKNLN